MGILPLLIFLEIFKSVNYLSSNKIGYKLALIYYVDNYYCFSWSFNWDFKKLAIFGISDSKQIKKILW